ncbi:amidohydrolase family protein [Pseudohaliea sp.]|uniref:amidohydrolase family protein n=1 Tax=Pseudohaliea sp. TaxID=2740289 RepID=UPI0032EBC254
MPSTHDPEGHRLPIKVDSTSNGEFEPLPLDPLSAHANELAQARATETARRLGLNRRTFLVSARGAACTLLAFNAARAAAGGAAGYYALAPETALEEEAANAVLGGNELIFDVQGHFVNPTGAWLDLLPGDARPLSGMPQAGCALASEPGERSYLQCLGPDAFVQDVFMDSDTELMVLSFVPSTRAKEPLTIEEAAAAQSVVAQLEGSKRLFLHGRVNPNQPGDIDDMRRLRDDFGICAWKTYTQWGPDGVGYWLDDPDTGIPFLEQARELGVKRVAIHKGIPFGKQSYEHSLCDDIGRAARRYPDIDFLVYHSGFVPGQPEGPYDPERNEGIDSLVKTVLDNDLGHGSNVYAELGSTWRYLLRDPDSAAHALGKLLKHLGEDNILWGTDSIWYGSPQDQIQAFRAFQIDPAVAEQHGYPALTAARKRKIFAGNALRVYDVEPGLVDTLSADRVARARARYREQPDPHFRTYGPTSRRQFLNLARWAGDGPL